MLFNFGIGPVSRVGARGRVFFFRHCAPPFSSASIAESRDVPHGFGLKVFLFARDVEQIDVVPEFRTQFPVAARGRVCCVFHVNNSARPLRRAFF